MKRLFCIGLLSLAGFTFSAKGVGVLVDKPNATVDKFIFDVVWTEWWPGPGQVYESRIYDWDRSYDMPVYPYFHTWYEVYIVGTSRMTAPYDWDNPPATGPEWDFILNVYSNSKYVLKDIPGGVPLLTLWGDHMGNYRVTDFKGTAYYPTAEPQSFGVRFVFSNVPDSGSSVLLFAIAGCLVVMMRSKNE
jgi:hypothetical protein